MPGKGACGAGRCVRCVYGGAGADVCAEMRVGERGKPPVVADATSARTAASTRGAARELLLPRKPTQLLLSARLLPIARACFSARRRVNAGVA